MEDLNSLHRSLSVHTLLHLIILTNNVERTHFLNMSRHIITINRHHGLDVPEPVFYNVVNIWPISGVVLFREGHWDTEHFFQFSCRASLFKWKLVHQHIGSAETLSHLICNILYQFKQSQTAVR